MKRTVEPEILDELPPDDPRAIRSRADLRRLNWLMWHGPIFRDILKANLKQPPRVITEIGTGDGTLMLNLAAELHTHWPGVRVILVDRQKVVSDATLEGFQKFGWHAELVTADIFNWVSSAGRMDVVIANLFLHHFTNEKLAGLFRSFADRTDFFLAGETRREWPSFAVCRVLGLLGCNSVTRHDAWLSMKAGFVGNELSALWPAGNGWELTERRVIFFTHLFTAQRRG